jgi:hypothetical protein
MSLEKVTVCAGHEVLMEVHDNFLLIVGDPQGILDEQLRTHPTKERKQRGSSVHYTSLL